jgi:hypothetical protein
MKTRNIGAAVFVVAILVFLSACTGVTKEDIASKDKQISDQAVKIADLDKQVSDQGATISTLNTQVSGLQTQVTSTQSRPTGDEVALRLAMRKLWEDHVMWTRLYIVEYAANLPGKDLTAARLMKNQEEIGNAIKPYYGEAAGNQLTILLKTHISGAVDVLSAAKAGDQTKLAQANTSWYGNGKEIADFLASANPNWPSSAMEDGMKMHLDLTLSEAVAELKGDHAASIAGYDKVHEHILGLADTLTDGIVKQFPQKFVK